MLCVPSGRSPPISPVRFTKGGGGAGELRIALYVLAYVLSASLLSLASFFFCSPQKNRILHLPLLAELDKSRIALVGIGLHSINGLPNGVVSAESCFELVLEGLDTSM